jgi:hypothetical protein
LAIGGLTWPLAKRYDLGVALMMKFLRVLAIGAFQIPTGWDDAGRRLNVSVLVSMALMPGVLALLYGGRIAVAGGDQLFGDVVPLPFFLIYNLLILFALHRFVVTVEFFDHIRASAAADPMRSRERNILLIFVVTSVIVLIAIIVLGGQEAR